MEEMNSVETMSVETKSIGDALIEASAEELSRETFRKIAPVACEAKESFEELKDILQDWDSFAKSLTSKTGAGVLRGYCLLITGQIREAEEVLKAHKRHEWAAYYYARLLSGAGRWKEALAAASDGYEKLPDSFPLAYVLVDIHSKFRQFEEAERILEKRKKDDAESPDFCFASGIYEERLGNYGTAIEHYRETVNRDGQHQDAYFRLGYLLDLHGTDSDEANEEAVEAYETCVKLDPIHTNAVINLGLLYEDRERYHDSIKCYETVLRCYPNHERAKLYLGDAQASTSMFYDKDQEKKADRQSQVLKIPVTDFELSVRSRNCLHKMNINTLGDLIMKTEQELLSYKNFGETSLDEIKVMLGQKGLRLGQGLEEKAGDPPASRNPLEATANPEVLDRSFDELDLSVRSRRCMERLGVPTVRELINKTEVELMAAKNFGMTSLNEIKEKLAESGLGLRG